MTETLFLVEGRTERWEYPDQGHEPIAVMRLVYAASKDEAKTKFIQALSIIEPYSHAVRAWVTAVHPAIT